MRPALAFALVILVGCGPSEPPLYDITGNATFAGQPIPKGIIHFDPDPMKGGKGQSGFANILDGKYDTSREGRGILGGAYVIRINGFDGKPADELPFGQALFPEYTEPRELPLSDSTQEFTISKKKPTGKPR